MLEFPMYEKIWGIFVTISIIASIGQYFFTDNNTLYMIFYTSFEIFFPASLYCWGWCNCYRRFENKIEK